MYKIDDHYSIVVLPEHLVDEVTDLVIASTEDSPYNKSKPSRDYLLSVVRGFVGVQQTRVCLVLLHDGVPSGFIAGVVNPHPLWSDIKVASELVWWTVQEHRTRGAGSSLILAFEEWARFVGADQVTMASLNNQYMDRLDTAYSKMGYRLTEKSYIKDLI